MSTVINTARKYPMMGERQVVIVKEAQELKGWNVADVQQQLTNYLQNPVPSTILVFGYKYKSLDKRTKLAKEIQSASEFLQSSKIYDNQIPGWIQSYAEARGVKLTQKAIMMLSENIGNNLQRLSNEIEKLLVNVKPGQEIDDVAIHKFVGISKDYNVFELQHAIATGSFAKALKIVNYFGANPNSHPIILTIANLFNYFSKLLLIHDSGSTDKNTVSRVIGVPPFYASEYLAASNRYPREKVVANILLLAETDLRSKGIGYNTGKDKEAGLLKELIYRIIH